MKYQSRMDGTTEEKGEDLPVETVACPSCQAYRMTRLFDQRDLALGVPGWYTTVRCDGCGLLYQNPRVCTDHLAAAYPDGYAAHTREPDLSRRLRRHGASVRWLLARQLGYRHLPVGEARWTDRARALLMRRHILEAFPPWTGRGRLLDVGCGSGKFLRQLSAVGWELTGIEFDEPAAAKAQAVTPHIIVGDPAHVVLPERSFDVITAVHVVEHLPDPLGALRNMLGWLAPGGFVIVEVPNVAGIGAWVFGRYWCGFDLPRHLVHFTPSTMTMMVERAGGRVVHTVHRTKPRYFLRSLALRLRDARAPFARALAPAMRRGPVRGLLKLLLEMALPVARRLRRGEATRYFIVRLDHDDLAAIRRLEQYAQRCN